jgi:hypothetical protein
LTDGGRRETHGLVGSMESFISTSYIKAIASARGSK